MSKVDQFESTFRSAEREVFEYSPLGVTSVLVVTDLVEGEAADYAERARKALPAVAAQSDVSWTVLNGDGYDSVESLLAVVEEIRPSIICTYRNLHDPSWKYGFSLGIYLDVLCQATSTPVLLLPHPHDPKGFAHSLESSSNVMAITDHLTGDQRLVSYAASLCVDGGTLFLTHVEDETSFNRIVHALERIPSLDTESSAALISKQLLKEPRDYVRSCRSVLDGVGASYAIEEVVTFGHQLAEYQRLIEKHRIHLLVMNTKDEDQLAMHGLAYPLAIELREMPLLLL